MNKKSKNIVGSLVVIFIPFCIYFCDYYFHRKPKQDKLEKNGCFTESEPISRIINGEAGYELSYQYTVDGVVYLGTESTPQPSLVKGKKFQVHYVCDEPEISDLIVDYD